MKTENTIRESLVGQVNISPMTDFYRSTTMLFSGEDESLITIDGYAQVFMTPFGGVEGVIGCVAPDVMAEGKQIIRNLTTGDPLVGVDQVISGTLAQTTPADVANMVGAIALASVKVVGARNTATIVAPTGRKLFMNFDLSVKFDNKADSGMKFSVTKPGQPVSSLTSFITASAS